MLGVLCRTHWIQSVSPLIQLKVTIIYTYIIAKTSSFHNNNNHAASTGITAVQPESNDQVEQSANLAREPDNSQGIVAIIVISISNIKFFIYTYSASTGNDPITAVQPESNHQVEESDNVARELDDSQGMQSSL